MSAVTRVPVPVHTAWRRLRDADQTAWDQYQAVLRTLFADMQAAHVRAFAVCEQATRNSMTAYQSVMRRACGDPVILGNPYPGIDPSDLPRAWSDHLARVDRAVADREHDISTARERYADSCAAARDQYEDRVAIARGQWLFLIHTGGRQHVNAAAT